MAVQNQYHIPHIDDLLYQIKGANYFNNIDLNYDCQQVPTEQADVWNTTFKYREGIFEWLVMPFGLTNAPKIFMHMMDDIL